MAEVWNPAEWQNRTVRELMEALEGLGSRAQSHPESPFYSKVKQRWDHDCILKLIPPDTAVLDLGCGDGELLDRLRREKRVTCQGVEREGERILECVDRGVPVIQADLDQGLEGFKDKSFDYVVVEETLQTVRHPERVLLEALRVGRTCIVSFPNFGNWRVQSQLLLKGTMPVTYHLPHTWYDTPNIHLMTIRDFQNWSIEKQVKVRQAFAYCDGEYHALQEDDNLVAEEALFEIERDLSS